MLKKRNVPVVTLVLLLAAAVTAGAAVLAYQVPAGPVIEATGAARDNSAPPEIPDAPALPAATAKASFGDDFSDATLSGWQALPQAPGTWVSFDGRLEQRGDSAGDISNEGSVLVAPGAALADGLFEVHAYPMSGEPLGVVFGGSDAGYYRVSLYQDLPNQSPKAYLHEVVLADAVQANGVRQIATNNTWQGYAIAEWQLVQVSATQDRITVSVGGAQLFDVKEAGRRSGWIGVWATADRGAAFDNIRVQPGNAER